MTFIPPFPRSPLWRVFIKKVARRGRCTELVEVSPPTTQPVPHNAGKLRTTKKNLTILADAPLHYTCPAELLESIRNSSTSV